MTAASNPTLAAIRSTMSTSESGPNTSAAYVDTQP